MMKAYPHYKYSGINWIGDIPSHWTCTKLKYFVEISNGSDPKTNGEIPVYGTGAHPFKTCGEYKEGPTVLLGRKGTIDIPHWIEGRYWNVDTAFDTKSKNGFMLRYFWYIANCLNLDEYKSTTAVPSMTQSAYDNIRIPIPPADEQVKIAAYLDEKTEKIDALITEKQAQVEDLRKYRTSLITETVTRGLNPDVPFRPSGIDWIGEIPQHWQISKLKYIADIQTGSTPPTSEPKYWDNPNKNWFTPGDFYKFKLTESSRKVSSLAFKEGACRIFHKDTVLLIAIGATLGKIGIVNKECSANQQINAISFNTNMVPLFGAYYLLICKMVLNQAANASTLPILNQEQTKQFLMPVPPLAEQQEIATFLELKTAKIDQAIAELELQINELGEYKKALITEAVTGKIDVRAWKHKEYAEYVEA